MPGRTRGNGGRNWRRALALSCALHGLLLVALGLGAAITTPFPVGLTVPGAVATTVAVEIPTEVDLTAIDTLASPQVLPPPQVAEVADPWRGAPDDQARPGQRFVASSEAGGIDRRLPAPDSGLGRGRLVEDPASRRDASTLHERLSDGAERYQPAHTRTASGATSPQAVRREILTGPGDSVQTRHAKRAPIAASIGVKDPEPEGAGSSVAEGVAVANPAAVPNPALPEADRAIATSTQGPLDAERGPRAFDVEVRGSAAADNRAARAASRDDHPGITDLTLATAAGDSAAGHGPSDKPGAVARQTHGPAPAPPGAPGTPGMSLDAQQTEERRYDRYKQVIGYRVNRERVFPRELALRLEQGETLLRFVVRPDGTLGDAIQVVKSSGFAEFDQAAVDAVRRASPFGPMPDPTRAKALPVKLLVAFPNPVIR